MKKLVVSAMVALIVMLPAMAMAQLNDIADPNQNKYYNTYNKLVIVKGENSWKSTGVTLKNQDKVAFKASGQILFSADDAASAVSPKGIGQLSYKRIWTGDAQHCTDPFGNINHAALIAKVGNNGIPFFVGENLNVTGKQGELFLGINDCTFQGSYYNSGKFDITLTIEQFRTGSSRGKELKSMDSGNSSGGGVSKTAVETHSTSSGGSK